MRALKCNNNNNNNNNNRFVRHAGVRVNLFPWLSLIPLKSETDEDFQQADAEKCNSVIQKIILF